MAKLLKDIKGFDDVGIGIIICGEGGGKYIPCSELAGYDLSNVQIYRYNRFFREMYETDELQKDNSTYLYCVKREDLV